jgi:hypothetical protein
MNLQRKELEKNNNEKKENLSKSKQTYTSVILDKAK